MLRSDPKGAEIFLNGKSTGKYTPAVIRLLPPGEYEVELSKSGYQTWKKHLTVLRRQITLANKDNSPIALFLSQPQISDYCPDCVNYFFQNGKELFIFSSTSTIALAGKVSEKQIQTNEQIPPDNIPNLRISDDGRWLYLLTNMQRTIISTENGNSIDISNEYQTINSIQPFGGNIFLILDGTNTLSKFNFDAKAKVLTKEHISAFSIKQNELFYISNNGLYVSDNASTTNTLLIQDLPNFSTGKILVNSNGEQYLLLDKILYQATGKLKIIGENVEQAFWDDRSKLLIFSNAHSIWIYDPATGSDPQLILRSDASILNPVYDSNTDQIFYLQDNVIKTVEALALNSRAITEIFPGAQSIEKFYLDQSGENIYVVYSKREVTKVKIR